MAAQWRTFSRALVRSVPDSFAASCLRSSPEAPINLALARQQHANYVAGLEQLLGLKVTQVPADERFPDCCYIEDTALVVDATTAVLARPGAHEREGEEAAVAAALLGAGLRVVHVIREPGTLDGGDVLQVGPNTLLVGVSRRTNAAGAEQLRAALAPRGYEVAAVPVEVGLHLKSALTALAGDTLLAADSAAGRALAAAVTAHPALRGRFQVTTLPDALAANVLRSGQHVVMPDSLPVSRAVLQRLCDARGLQLHSVPLMTEHAKADASLTCCSILF